MIDLLIVILKSGAMAWGCANFLEALSYEIRGK